MLVKLSKGQVSDLHGEVILEKLLNSESCAGLVIDQDQQTESKREVILTTFYDLSKENGP